MQKISPLIVAMFIGVAILVVAIAAAELLAGPRQGHRIDTNALPPQAKAILAEQPGTPISTEQWSRLDKVMLQHGGWPGGSQLLVASIRHSWYWFVLLPLVAIGAVRLKQGKWAIPVAALLASPSLLSLAYAFSAATHAALR